MYVDGVKNSLRTRAHCPPSPHFAPTELRSGTATHKTNSWNMILYVRRSVSLAKLYAEWGYNYTNVLHLHSSTLR